MESYLAEHPDHLVATAYLGSLHAMYAGASHFPWIKLKHATTASAMLDGAHERWLEGANPESSEEMYPGELEILLLRGVAYANFPAFLGKTGIARNCLEKAEKHPAFAAIPAPYQALAFAHLAVMCNRAGEGSLAHSYLEHGMVADEETTSTIWRGR
ncbi:hypothetical protein [Mesorhizobium sp. 1B3]|uniref:hypothetical protein n=1 Tax=Mesorhizobium sp. 1B3 TaxID=3243599 RepID=UPI003D96B576